MDRPFYASKIIEIIPVLLPYLLVTFEILIGVVLVGLGLGFLLARAMLSKSTWQN